MRFFLLFFLLFLFSIFIYFLPLNFLNTLNNTNLHLINLTNITNNTNIKLLINQTNAYIKKINQSSYILFYPNLSNAYAYMNKTNNLTLIHSMKNTINTIKLLNKARLFVFYQQQRIYLYRQVSFKIISVLIGFTLILFYFFVNKHELNK